VRRCDRDALTRHLRPRRRLWHAGVGRSGQRRRLYPHGAASQLQKLRRQPRPQSVPTSRSAVGQVTPQTPPLSVLTKRRLLARPRKPFRPLVITLTTADRTI